MDWTSDFFDDMKYRIENQETKTVIAVFKIAINIKPGGSVTFPRHMSKQN
jgi:hypothetical protein